MSRINKRALLISLIAIMTFGCCGCVDYSKDRTEESADSTDSAENAESTATSETQDLPVIVATSMATVQICEKLGIPLAGVPESSLSTVPDCYADATNIGSPMSPDMEIISTLHPDWILSPVSLISDLKPKYEAQGYDYAFLNLSSIQGMYKSVQQLGQIFDCEEAATDLIEEFETYYDNYATSNDTANGPTVLILMGLPGSYVVATPNSYVGNLVELAGGRNVYSDETEDFINVNVEDMLKKKPDIILRTSHALPDQVMAMFDEEFATNDIWKHFDAVKSSKVYDLSNENFGMSANFNYEDALSELGDIFNGTVSGSNGE